MTAPDTTENDNAGAPPQPPPAAAPSAEGAAIAEGSAAATTDEPANEPASTDATGPTPIDIPAHIAEQLPVGTVAHLDSGDTIVATVPMDGTDHRISAKFGNEWHHLVAEVSAFFHNHFGG